MRDKQYLLFDLDGTLTDPKVGITKAVAYALRSFGIEVEDLNSLCNFIGPPLKESFMKYYGMNSEQGDKAVDTYREYFRPHGVYENEVYDGILELLSQLRDAGKHLILASSKPTEFVEIILNHFHLREYFEVVVGSELDGTRVVKEEVIEYALQQANVADYSSVVMIGDREHDVIGAHKNGVEAIGVTYGYGNRAEHEACDADVIVESICELEQVLLK